MGTPVSKPMDKRSRQLQNTGDWAGVLASYPGFFSQLFSQPWQNAVFPTAAKKALREGLGSYEATGVPHVTWRYYFRVL